MLASGRILGNTAHWFILGNLRGGAIGFVNIYASNKYAERCMLWETLLSELPRTCRWILVGDFNVVESRSDKSTLCGRIMVGRERTLFLALLSSLGVVDYPRSAGSLLFSWDNARMHGSRVMARLDRIYTFSPGHSILDRKIVEYVIRGDGVISDHHPVQMRIELEPLPSRPSR